MYRIGGLIHNVAANTWHPVLFRWAPMPGGLDAVERVKSGAHHTAGFHTREEAIAETGSHEAFKGVPFDDQFIYPWDGEGVPAVVAFVRGERLVTL